MRKAFGLSCRGNPRRFETGFALAGQKSATDWDRFKSNGAIPSAPIWGAGFPGEYPSCSKGLAQGRAPTKTLVTPPHRGGCPG